MIQVTRFNHTHLYINADLIEFVESTPDTVITTVSGRKVLALESAEEVRKLILAYRHEAGPIIWRMAEVEGVKETSEEAA